ELLACDAIRHHRDTTSCSAPSLGRDTFEGGRTHMAYQQPPPPPGYAPQPEGYDQAAQYAQPQYANWGYRVGSWFVDALVTSVPSWPSCARSATSWTACPATSATCGRCGTGSARPSPTRSSARWSSGPRPSPGTHVGRPRDAGPAGACRFTAGTGREP